MTVYLLHFERPISRNHTCQHYCGSTDKLIARLDMHKACPDARLLQVAKERGIGFCLARTWPGGRERERQIKSWKMGPRLCPVCKEDKVYEEWACP